MCMNEVGMSRCNNKHSHQINSLLLPPPSINQVPLIPQHEANADSGTTGNYICVSDISMLCDVQPTSHGILVKMPNGSFIQSTHTARLNLPSLPAAAREAHVFPSLAGSLLSIGLLCDCDLIAIYDKDKVVIQTREGAQVLSGPRCPTTHLWMIDLDHTHHTAASTSHDTPAPHSAAASIHAPRAQEQVVATYHACLNWPSAPTFIAAVEKGYVVLPGLTTEMVKKFPPNATATAKGHLDQLRQGLLSTKPLTESTDDWHPTKMAPTVTHVSQPPISLQYVAPGMHRANKAERCIRTWKNHFLATLAGTDPSFPLIAWDELVPQAELTLNLMRSSGITPHISAWHQLNGPYIFDRTPIAPPGMRVVVHEKPDKRPSWGYHGVDGFYVSPVLRGNYSCFKVFITDTKKTRITDTPRFTSPRYEPD